MSVSDEYYDLMLKAKNETIDSLKDRIDELEDVLGYFRDGYKGGCYACEIVGEKNVELHAENETLKNQLTECRGFDCCTLEPKLNAADACIATLTAALELATHQLEVLRAVEVCRRTVFTSN